MAIIRQKRGTLAQLVTAAGAGQLLAGEPYWITDLEMTAVGVSTTAYRFDGVLQLNETDPVPSGYTGAVARPGTGGSGLSEAQVRTRSFLRC